LLNSPAPPYRRRARLLLPAFAFFFLAFASVALAQAPAWGWTHQPANLGDLKPELRRYHNSGDYERDLAAVAGAAQDYVEWRAGQVARPALVLDIDETSLSNWPELVADDFGYIPDGPCHLPKGPCGVHAWERSARAAAIAPTLRLFNAAQAKGVAVFFITGRHEPERAATERNLRRVGYRGWARLLMEPAGSKFPSAADFKAPQRARIEAQGYSIIANMGDQPSDLAGGHAERTFLLPNPFYRIP
jgi:HAD superfamily, subfamily IIIB (Acid phosphatase)